MPSSSFNKKFVVQDDKAIIQLQNDIKKPIKVKIKRRDYELDKISGIQLIKSTLS